MRVLVVHNAVAPDAAADDRDVLVQRDAVMAALSRRGHDCQSLDCTLNLEEARRRLLERRPEVVFNLVESLAGSDRLAHLFPSLLESLGIPYTANSAAALWLTNNKLLAKERLRQAGLPTPPWYGVGSRFRDAESLPTEPAVFVTKSTPAPFAGRDYTGRFIVKAIWEHASFGLRDDSIVEVAHAEELRRRVEQQAARLGRECFAEQFIEGREFNLSLLTQSSRHTPCAGTDGTRSVPTTLPPAEIDFSAFPVGKPRIVGYEAKWDDASFEFHQTPRRFDFPPEDRPLLQRLVELAQRCWEVFDLRGYVRVDFRVDRGGQPWILEINTNPCLSPDAGYAAALQRAEISYEDAMQRIVDEAAKPGPGSTEAVVRSAGFSPSPDNGLKPALRTHVLPTDPAAVRRIVESTGFFYPAECDVAVELVEERLAKGEGSGYFFVFAEYDDAPGTMSQQSALGSQQSALGSQQSALGSQQSAVSSRQSTGASQSKTLPPASCLLPPDSCSGPVAYACYGPIACTVGSYDLFWIAVDQEHQGHGFGRLLLEESERLIRAAGGRRVYIETSNRPQYLPTRGFYDRCGYHCEAVLKEFYGAGDDKVVYVKALDT